MGHKKGNLWRAQDPAIRVRSGPHMTNKLPTVLFLRAFMCRASIRWCFREDKAVLLQQNID